MQELAQRDYFTDPSVLVDPYSYLEALREAGPVIRLPARDDVVTVLGFDESVQVLKDVNSFSSWIAAQGPAAPLPFTPSGADITSDIEKHRSEVFGGDLLVTLDGDRHTFSRSILMRLFTPMRLKANLEFIETTATRYVNDVVAKGQCELVKEVATPFVTEVVADILGVPADHRKLFLDAIEAGPNPGSLNQADLATQGNAMAFRGRYIAQYVMERRQQPREDVLSELANAKYPDDTTPEVPEIVRLASFLFGAGQDTSAKLLGNAVRYIVDVPGLQEELRADPSLIPGLIEEVLRLEGSTKMTGRIAKKDTQIGDMRIPAGTRVFVSLAAANRDPRRWEAPNEFRMGRPRIKEHLAFGRGLHACAGAPLAREEVRVILEKFLASTSSIDLDADVHGGVGHRRYNFEPSFIIRGLANLNVKFVRA